MDENENVYVAGTTGSDNFQTINPLQAARSGSSDIFITKFNSTGSSLSFSTYLGGNAGETGKGIVIDEAHNVYLSGETTSSDFPLANPYQSTYGDNTDAFVTKLSATGSALDFSTYLGGTGADRAEDLAIDSLDNVYIIGSTSSVNFPTVNESQTNFGGGNFDAFVTKFTTSGGISYSTYLGDAGDDEGNDIATSLDDAAYLTGYTSSDNFPTANPYQANRSGSLDVFVTKLIENADPNITAGSSSITINEASLAANTGTYSDPDDGDDVTITASVGTIIKTGTSIGTWSWSFTPDDGSVESQTVTVTADDGNGGIADTNFSLVVNNVAPTAVFTASSHIDEDTSATLSFVGQLDPSTADTFAGFVYSYDCTDDGIFEVVDTISSSDTSCFFATPGTFTAKGRIKDKDGGFMDYTAAITVKDIPTLDDFVLLGSEGVWLKAGIIVNSGDVGANVSSVGPFLDSGVEMSIGMNTSITNTTSAVFGDDIRLKAGSQVNDAHYNTVSGPGTITGSSFTPLSLPLLTFPTVPSFATGTTNVTVPINGFQTLSAGDYGDLLVNHDETLIFSGGNYTFSSWDIRKDANLYFAAPSEIRISGRVDTAIGVEIRPQIGSGIDASDIKIIATGINGASGNLGVNPKAVEVGSNSIIEANIYVPNGTLWLKDNVTALGPSLASGLLRDRIISSRI